MAYLNPLSAAAASILLVASGPAFAAVNVPVDDFEVASFDLALTGPGSVAELVDIPYPPNGHCISPVRTLNCQVGSGATPNATIRMSLDAGSQLDDAMSVLVPAQAVAVVNYEWGYVADLTLGGQVDRIEMDVAGSIGDAVSLAIYGEGNLGNVVTETITSAGPLEFDLADFFAIDATRIEGMTFSFTDAGAYLVSEIRLRGDSSGPIDFDIRAEATQTPPLPSPPIEFDIVDALVAEPVFAVDFGILSVDAGFTPALDLTLGTVPGLAGMSMLWSDPAPFADFQMSLYVDVANENGLFADMYPPDPIHGPEGVLLTFPTVLRDGPGGAVYGQSETWLTIDPGANQGLEFGAVSVAPRAGRAWSEGFVVTFDVYGTSGVETTDPILDFTWWGEYDQTVATGTPVTSEAASRSRLRVNPSVTRGGAQISWGRPLERGALLSLLDVQGRRVGAIRAVAGATSVRWDGRGSSGRSLPAGVYFVAPDFAAAPARVVKLR